MIDINNRVTNNYLFLFAAALVCVALASASFASAAFVSTNNALASASYPNPGVSAYKTTPVCTDSDGLSLYSEAESYFVTGTTTGVTSVYGTPRTYHDQCVLPNGTVTTGQTPFVREYLCSSSHLVQSTMVACPHGAMCHDGECTILDTDSTPLPPMPEDVAATPTLSSASCIDSDGGWKYESKGTAIGVHYNTGEKGLFTDSCTSVRAGNRVLGPSNYIVEYACSDGKVGMYYAQCQVGQYCYDGACIPSAPTATPTPTPTPTPSAEEAVFTFEKPVWDRLDSASPSNHTCIWSSLEYTGKYSWKTTYQTAAGQQTRCGTFFYSQNFNVGDSIAFWYKTNRANEQVKLVLFSGETRTPYEAAFTTTAAGVSGWVRVTIPWSSFTRAVWASDSASFDRTQITGIGTAIENTGATRRNAYVLIDDVSVISGSDQVVLDFEPNAWEMLAGSTSNSSCLRVYKVNNTGSYSWRLNYKLYAGQYTRCLDAFYPLNLGSEGVSFWIKSSKSGQAINFVLYSGDSLAPFEATINTLTASAGWTKVTLPWSSFVRAAWAPAGSPAVINPTQITGLGASVQNTGAAVRSATVWIDDIAIIGTAAPTPTPVPTATPTPTPTVTPTPTPGHTSRIQPTDLEYLGAFRLPETGSSEVNSWYYGGNGLAYYSQGDATGSGDGFSGSLFGLGHDWEHRVSEITIPVPRVSATKNVEELNTATTIQPFRNIGAALFGYTEIPHSGITYISAQGAQSSGKLY
ncbi:TPA: hypothetical protein HA318_02570, partial [Candidatus Micrarchaeota archaeon]|nr:hypothetical protein [Candidatus Micrarchaeota archaeon]